MKTEPQAHRFAQVCAPLLTNVVLKALGHLALLAQDFTAILGSPLAYCYFFSVSENGCSPFGCLTLWSDVICFDLFLLESLVEFTTHHLTVHYECAAYSLLLCQLTL